MLNDLYGAGPKVDLHLNLFPVHIIYISIAFGELGAFGVEGVPTFFIFIPTNLQVDHTVTLRLSCQEE